MPDLPYQEAIKIRNTELDNTNSEPLLEKAGGPTALKHLFQIIQDYHNQKLIH